MPILASITKLAATVTDPAKAGAIVHEAAALAVDAAPRAGVRRLPARRVRPASGEVPAVEEPIGRGVDPDPPVRPARPDRRRPSGRRSWSAATSTGPGVGRAGRRGRAPAGAGVHQRARPGHAARRPRAGVPPYRGLLKQRADLVVVLGTPLDFRLGFGRFGGRPSPTSSTPSRSGPPTSTCSPVAGDLASHAAGARRARGTAPTTSRGSPSCAPRRRRPAAEVPLLAAAADPIKPSRVYGSCAGGSARDAVVICDGGDFASYAGKYVEVTSPGCWLDTGPVRVPRQRAGLRHRRPGRPARRQVVPCSATARPASA